MGTLEKIREKLDKEEKGGKFDRYASVMKKYIKEALLTLCGQSETFAAAVLDGDTFEDCMKKVTKGIGGSISDLEAVKRAVQFYLKGADVSFQMVITTPQAGKDNAAKQGAPAGTGKPAEIIDLTDFF